VRSIVEQISVLNYQTVYFNTVFIYESIFPKEQFLCPQRWLWDSLQYLNNVIIIKTKVLLPQVNVTFADFGYPV
jgi:hypothetical protein